MVNDPRSPKPGAPQPPDPLDLLRELARDRVPTRHEDSAPNTAGPSNEELESLRALAETLNRQLHGAPGPSPEPAHDHWQDPTQDASYDPSHYPEHPEPYPEPAQYPVPPLARSGDWRHAARAEWADFCDGLPPAHTLVPRFRLPEIVFVAIAAVVLGAAALGGYIHHRRALAPGANEPATSQPGQSPSSFEPPQPSVAEVKKEQQACEATAQQDPDSLYFLVLPVVRTEAGVASSFQPVPMQTVGSSFQLLGTDDTLAGLTDGKLKVRPDRYTFTVLDTANGASFSWTSATGMVRLGRKATSGFKNVTLGFDFSPTQAGPQMSAAIQRDRGTCYWVNVLVQ
jgi:hypothetical protein